jgi:tetratricopeptide (TPR) repeat protein
MRAIKWLKFFFFLLLGSFVSSCVIDQKPTESVRYVLSGNKYAEKGNFEDSAEQYRLAIKQNPQLSAAKRNLAFVLVKSGQYQEAISFFNEIVSFYPKDAELFYFLGEAYRAMGFEKNAIKAYQTSLRLSSDDLRALKSLAWVYVKIGEYEKAEKLIRDEYKRNPFDLQLILIVTTLDVKKKRFAQAVQALQEFEKSHFKIISKDLLTAEAEKILLLNVLGNAYAGLNNCVKAQELFHLILDSRPFLVSTLTDSAKCDLKTRHLFQAQQKLEKAYCAQPHDPETLFLLAKVYATSHPQKAIFYFKKFINLSRNNKNFDVENKQAQALLVLLQSRNLSSDQKSH